MECRNNPSNLVTLVCNSRVTNGNTMSLLTHNKSILFPYRFLKLHVHTLRTFVSNTVLGKPL